MKMKREKFLSQGVKAYCRVWQSWLLQNIYYHYCASLLLTLLSVNPSKKSILLYLFLSLTTTTSNFYADYGQEYNLQSSYYASRLLCNDTDNTITAFYHYAEPMFCHVTFSTFNRPAGQTTIFHESLSIFTTIT